MIYEYALAAIGGILLGMLSALPGVHVTVLLIGLLPILTIRGDLAAIALVGAVGSSQATTALAKTFHPVTNLTVKSATPEQVMAYVGQGLKAIKIQLHASWVGWALISVLGIPLILWALINTDELKTILNGLKPVTLPIILGFMAFIAWRAHNKLMTLATLVVGSLLGFYSLNLPALAGNPASLAPLLGGVFALPGLLMVVFERGRVQRFPTQRAVRFRPPTGPTLGYGAFGGVLTALVAGVGSGSAVSCLADQTDHEEYLGMHTASETANHISAVLLVILVGITHSGVGVALKQQLPVVDWALTGVLFLTLTVGMILGTQITESTANTYATWISRVPQRTTALAVAVCTVALIWHETGFTGILVAITASTIGLAARLNCVPNQALSAVLMGPVLITALGLAEPLGRLFGIMR